MIPTMVTKALILSMITTAMTSATTIPKVRLDHIPSTNALRQ